MVCKGLFDGLDGFWGGLGFSAGWLDMLSFRVV